jgi:putative transposase
MTKTASKGYSLSEVCEYIGISRQAYYQRLAREQKKSEIYNMAERKVIKNREKRSRVGLRTIYHKENLRSLLGTNQFEKEMSARGYALKPYKSRLKTTDSRGHHYKFDNLVPGCQLNGSNQLIVGDITYYQNETGLYYIFHFKDYYTQEVKGLIGNKNMEGINAEKCLRQVFEYNKQAVYQYKMILHTDGGGQYRSHKFQFMLREAQIRPSHAGNCLENGLAERTNGILKNEYLVDYQIKSVSHLNSVLKKVKQQINEVWPSAILNYMTPRQFTENVNGMRESDRPIRVVKSLN